MKKMETFNKLTDILDKYGCTINEKKISCRYCGVLFNLEGIIIKYAAEILKDDGECVCHRCMSANGIHVSQIEPIDIKKIILLEAILGTVLLVNNVAQPIIDINMSKKNDALLSFRCPAGMPTKITLKLSGIYSEMKIDDVHQEYDGEPLMLIIKNGDFTDFTKIFLNCNIF